MISTAHEPNGFAVCLYYYNEVFVVFIFIIYFNNQYEEAEFNYLIKGGKWVDIRISSLGALTGICNP